MDKLRLKLKRSTPALRKECEKVLAELFELMAKGVDEIYFASLTQGMWDIKTQLELNLTTEEHYGATFFWYGMDDTRKCAIYIWRGDHLLRVDNY